jgi:hypothetical protein
LFTFDKSVDFITPPVILDRESGIVNTRLKGGLMLVPDMRENFERCVCAECPTYTRCMRDGREGLYCARGATKCEITEEEDCSCARCPVDQEYRLTARLDLMEKKILKLNQFYCVKGPAGSKK